MLSLIINLIKRCAVTKTEPDDKAFPVAQVEYFGKTALTEVIWPYGLGGVAPRGAYGVTFNLSAQEENRASILTTPNLRIKNLSEGETYFYNLVVGTGILNRADGSMEITVKGDKKVTIDKDLNINVSGDVTISVSGKVDLLSDNVNLGSGGPAIARVGDSVDVNGQPGTITTGSTRHTAN